MVQSRIEPCIMMFLSRHQHVPSFVIETSILYQLCLGVNLKHILVEIPDGSVRCTSLWLLKC